MSITRLEKPNWIDPKLFQFINEAYENVRVFVENISPAELAFIDGVTAGTATANKALVLGATKQVDEVRVTTNLYIGALTEGYAPTQKLIAVEDAKTMSPEENIAGLSSAITLANEIRGDFINHAANATRHTTGQQDTSGIAAEATDLATLITLTTSLMTLYVAHNADAILDEAWVYHDAQAADKALASEVAPTTLAECITKLTDLKAKYNDHEDETTGHATEASVTADQVAADNAANGAANRVPVAGVLAGDHVCWSILDGGTGTVKGVSAVAGAGYIDFTFSADPQNDAIISYMVSRTLV